MIGKEISNHADASRCDRCGVLILAYGDDQSFERTRSELGTRIEAEGEIKGLRILGKKGG